MAQDGSNDLGTMQLGEGNFIGDQFLQDGSNVGGIAQFGNDNVVNRFLQTGDNRGCDLPGRLRQRRPERADRQRATTRVSSR
jgi:hypothetical protein